MHFPRILLFLCLTIPVAALSEPSEAQQKLEDILTQQQKLFKEADYAKKADDFDPQQFQVDVQNVCYQYNDWIKRHPDMAAGYVAYGLLLAKVDMRRESMAMLLKANKLDPNVPQVKNQLGNFLAEDGKPIEAANYFLAAIRLDPDQPLYHYQLGRLLSSGRSDFVNSGAWTEEALEHTMYLAFKKAAELAPDQMQYTYRYAECFYELHNPDWNEALKVWDGIEKQCKPGLEQQTILLHKANILIKQDRIPEAKALLATVDVPQLAGQKEKLVALLAETRKK